MSRLQMNTRIREFLFPPECELGPDFEEEIRLRALHGLRIASWMGFISGLIFVVVDMFFLAGRLPRSPNSHLGTTLLGLTGVLLTQSRWGRTSPRGPSIVLAMAIGTVLMMNQLAMGSHIYGHFGGLITVLMVMATLGTLQPFWVLVCGSYFVLLYVGLGIWKDPTVGWPPAPSFVLPCASLGVTATISVWLAGLHHRNHRTEFRLRRQLSEAFSNLQQTQAQLLATEKALSQSQIVAALSHELNNPLGVVLANLSTQSKLSERLRDQWEKGSPSSSHDVGSLLSIHEELNQGSIKAAQRISNLVGRLREFSHLDRSETRMIDLNDELMKNLQVIRSEIPTPVEVQTDLDPAVPRLLCQPQKLGLAFGGLLRNAFKAAGSSGTVRVSTSLSNEQVSVLIEDDGCGMNAAELKTLFDPKFIPQSGKVTTSWGLATSQQIFLQHGGHLELDSTLGKGTTARVRLPVKSRS